MKTPRTQSMHRSGTMPVQLPKIPKLNIKQSRYNDNSIINNTRLNTSNPNNNGEQTNNKNNSNRSSFMRKQTPRFKQTHSFILSKAGYTQRVQQHSIRQEQYPYIQTTSIQKQQMRLKQLLKEFNEQTVIILQKYIIDKPIKRQYTSKKPQPQQLQHIRQRQSQNSLTMIFIMKKEIEKLQSRCEDLKYISKEQIEQKIKQLRQEKAKIVQTNKDLSREITLNGFQIVKGRQSLVKELDYQLGLLNSKKDRLKQNKERVEHETQLIEQKTAEINYQMEQLDQTSSYTFKFTQQKDKNYQQARLYQEYQLKKRHYDHLKLMTQSTNYQQKHRYLQLLKTLDESESGNEKLENRDYELSQKIESALMYIQQLQRKCKQLMIGKFNNSKTSSSTKAQIIIANNNDDKNSSNNPKNNNINNNNDNNNNNNSSNNKKNDKNQYPNSTLFNTELRQDKGS